VEKTSLSFAIAICLLYQVGCGDGSKTSPAPTNKPPATTPLPTKEEESPSFKTDRISEKSTDSTTKKGPPLPSSVDVAAQLSELGADLERDEDNLVTAVILPSDVENPPIARLIAFPKLRRLNLDHAKIEVAALATLSDLSRLERLSLNSTSLGDAALRQIAKLPELKRLDMSWSEVTDAGTVELIPCKKLETLNLSWTNISDDSLEHFKNMTSLRRLILEGTNVSQAAVDKLRGSRPDLTIEY